METTNLETLDGLQIKLRLEINGVVYSSETQIPENIFQQPSMRSAWELLIKQCATDLCDKAIGDLKPQENLQLSDPRPHPSESVLLTWPFRKGFYHPIAHKELMGPSTQQYKRKMKATYGKAE